MGDSKVHKVITRQDTAQDLEKYAGRELDKIVKAKGSK